MPRIDLKVEVQDTVIQQVLSTSISLPLPMIEDEVSGETLRPDVQEGDDASLQLAHWDSWLFRSWKSYWDIMYLLEENWQHLLGIFQKFSL